MMKQLNYYLKKLNYKKLDIILSFVIINFPILLIYINNYQTISFINFIPLFKLLFVLFIFILVVSCIFFNHFSKILFTLSAAWIFQYYASHPFDAVVLLLESSSYDQLLVNLNLKEFFIDGLQIIILAYLVIVSFLIYKFYNQILKNFFIYFIIINIFISTLIGVFQKSETKTEKFSRFSTTNINIPINKTNMTRNFSEKKENIYFFLLDQMVSKETAYKQFNVDYDAYIDQFISKNFIFYENSKSFSRLTKGTLSDIFFIDSNRQYSIFDKPIKASDVPMIKILNQFNYNKYYFDSVFIPCSNYFTKFFDQCVSFNNVYGANYEILVLDYFLSQNLFLKSFFDLNLNLFGIIKEEVLTLNSRNTELSRFKFFYEKNFDLINKKNNFFFIHNLGPHFPYRDQNCKIISRFPKKNKAIENIHMASSIHCALSQMTNVFNLIKKTDPGSYIIIQGDHGFSYYGIGDRTKERGLDIFNLVDYGFNNSCKSAYKKVYDNIHAIKSLLRCAELISQ